MKRRLILFACLALLGTAFPLALVVLAVRATAETPGFPIDDPWIHLTYARNLAEHFAFTYFPGDPSSAGSTAPLYTSLLAVGLRFFQDEKLLSWTIGLVFQFAFLCTFGAWAWRRLGGVFWPSVAVALVAFDSRVGIVAVSGMETSCFLWLVSLAFLARVSKWPIVAGVALGLAVWVRPDGLLLLAVFAIDAVLDRIAADAPQVESDVVMAELRGWVRLLVPAGLLILAYFAFNWAVGGGILPNTFDAKTTFYRSRARGLFITKDVVETYTSNGWLVLWPLAVAGMLAEGYRLVKRRRGLLRAEVGWVLALTLAYLMVLPYSHVYNRYLLPALPAFCLLAVSAARWLAVRAVPDRLRENVVARVALASILLIPAWLHGQAAVAAGSLYSEKCEYFRVRHERTGRWLAEHTPVDAVIATHDVGAIAFYSRRRIVDVVGIVQPEVVDHLGKSDYTRYLAELFEREGVTHLAMLRNWLEVSNVEPLFRAAPEPEFLEVFEWQPGRTHLVPPPATNLVKLAEAPMRSGDFDRAATLLDQSTRIDDENARAFYLLGLARFQSRRFDQAAAAYLRATNLQARFAQAQLGLAQALYQQGDRLGAYRAMETLLEWQPDYPGGRKKLEELARELGR